MAERAILGAFLLYMNAENVIPSWGDFLSSQTLPGTIL